MGMGSGTGTGMGMGIRGWGTETGDRSDGPEPGTQLQIQLQLWPTLPICAGYCSSGYVLTQRVSGQRSPLFRYTPRVHKCSLRGTVSGRRIALNLLLHLLRRHIMKYKLIIQSNSLLPIFIGKDLCLICRILKS